MALPLGITIFSQAEGVYGHTITVPDGYNVVIHKSPLLEYMDERVSTYGPNTSRFVPYFWWDTPIIHIAVTKKNEIDHGL
jgi:hypothetical protein